MSQQHLQTKIITDAKWLRSVRKSSFAGERFHLTVKQGLTKYEGQEDIRDFIQNSFLISQITIEIENQRNDPAFDLQIDCYPWSS